MWDGLEVWPGTSGYYTGFDWNFRIYCLAAVLLHTLPTRGVRGFDQDSQAAQDRICQGLYITPTQRWSGRISPGLVSKISSPWLLGGNFSSLRCWSSSSKKTILKWKQEYKMRELSPQSSGAPRDALNILQHWCYLVTVQSGCGSQSAFLTYCKEQGYRKKTTWRYQRKHSVELPLKALLGEKNALGLFAENMGLLTQPVKQTKGISKTNTTFLKMFRKFSDWLYSLLIHHSP